MADIDSRNADFSARADEHEESSLKVFSDAYADNSLTSGLNGTKIEVRSIGIENSISFPNPFEKQLKPVEMTEAQQQVAAEKIVHFITKRDDFGTPFQRNEIEKYINTAMSTGQLSQLVEKVNADLKNQNSNLKLDASQREESVPYGHWGLSGKHIATAEYKHPVWIDDFDKVTHTADLRLVNKSTGTAEDGIKVSGATTERPYPPPTNACGEGTPVRKDDPIHGINRRQRWMNGELNGELKSEHILPNLRSLKLKPGV